jgi:hypothetical protein
MARTSYSVKQIKNTARETMGLYITDPGGNEHFIADFAADESAIQLLPKEAKWNWKTVVSNSPIALGASIMPETPPKKSFSLGEGNDGGR